MWDSYQFSKMHILYLFDFFEVLWLIKVWLNSTLQCFSHPEAEGRTEKEKLLVIRCKTPCKITAKPHHSPSQPRHLWEAFPKPATPEQHKWTWTGGFLFMDPRLSQPGYNLEFAQLWSPETLLSPTGKFFLYLQFIFQSFSHQQGFLEWAPDLSQSLEIAQFYHKLLSADPALRSCPTKELLA